MDTFNLIVNGALFICSGVAFAHGVKVFFRKKVALFNQLVTCGLGCMMLGRLFNIVTVLTNSDIPTGFTVGKLGFVGGFMFLFSASFGQMNGLVDGGEKEFRKYRCISLLAPVLIASSYLFVLFGSSSIEDKIVSAVIIAFFAQCSYFNLKHLIIPDIDMGIIKSIRGYNLLALILAVLSTAEVVIGGFGVKAAVIIVTALLCLTYLAVVPVLKRGAQKWTA